jgi:serine/threonine protein kinase
VRAIPVEISEGALFRGVNKGDRVIGDSLTSQGVWLRIIRQVCRALEAAHSEDVVHRDLKPQNVMVDETGRVRVMDFGLARSVEMSGLTQTGAVLGTPAYMSPEQAKGQPLDARSDLFSLGIIFYDLLTGRVPFHADSVWASLLARTQVPVGSKYSRCTAVVSMQAA